MELLIISIALIINVVISNIIANLGKQKRIGYNTAWLCSFLLSPILGILFVIASVPLSEKEIEEKKQIKEKYNEQKYLYSKNEDTIIICIGITFVLLLILYRHLI